MSDCQSTGQLAPGIILEGRYVIINTLGRGGMGAVYLALDTRLSNSQVAIKEMRVKTEGKEELELAISAFKREAALLTKLRHEALPRISDFFCVEKRWYLVMDYIEGETLKEVVQKRGSVPEKELLDWAFQLCNILDYLHSQEPPIIFRDLKPTNIMLTKSGHIKLIDFGIARHFKAGSTTDTTAYGSTGYAPPEQYGQNQTDPRSDLYALGATLHYLLTGIDPDKKPFCFESPSNYVSVTQNFESAIMKAIELKPENRPGSARELLAIFQQNKAQIPIDETVCLQAQEPFNSEETTILKVDESKENNSVTKNKPLYIALGVILSLALLVVFLGVKLSDDRSTSAKPEAKKESTQVTKEDTTADDTENSSKETLEPEEQVEAENKSILEKPAQTKTNIPNSAKPEQTVQVGQEVDKNGWPIFKGAWFKVSYPANFTPLPLSNTSTSSGASDRQQVDSVLFQSPDGTVDFYVFTPFLNEEPLDIMLHEPSERLRETKDSEDSGYRYHWLTIDAKDKTYSRSYVYIDNKKTGERTVFGIQYKDQASYNKYKSQYLQFKKSHARLR